MVKHFIVEKQLKKYALPLISFQFKNNARMTKQSGRLAGSGQLILKSPTETEALHDAQLDAVAL